MTRLSRYLVSIALALAWSTSVSASEQLFTGSVQRQIVAPSGTPDCARPCPANQRPDANGVTRVCVSNAGGCQVVEVKVLHDYLGTSNEPVERFSSRTGEWGQLSFPDSAAPVLVHAVDGVAHWMPLTTRDGVDVIDPKDAAFRRAFFQLQGVTFTLDADGKLPVAQLVQQLRN
jgi:hypothetical protein